MCFLVDLFFLIELFFLIDFLHEAAPRYTEIVGNKCKKQVIANTMQKDFLSICSRSIM